MRTHAIASWTFRGGSVLYPMSLFLDNLRVTVSPVDSFGAFVGGNDEPESVPGGGGGQNNANSDGGTGASPVDGLRFAVEDADLAHGTESSLLAKLDAAAKQLAKGNTDTALQQLEAFLREVHAQSGKAIDDDVADELTEMAEALIELLSA